MDTVFFESTGDRHAWTIGGLTALERRIREVARQGAGRAVVAASPVALPRPLPIPVEFVPVGSPPPDGARRERADVIAGIELDGEPARRRAEWTLIRQMNKSFEGPVDALINWRFSMRITRLLARRSLAVTPNHVTIAAILVGLTASWLAGGGGHARFALAGVLLEVNSILDSCDGELARLRYQYSRLGQWLDNLSDDVVDNLFLIAVGAGLGGGWRWLGLAAAGGRLLVAVTTYLSVYRRTGTGDVFAFRWWFETDKATAADVYDPRSPVTWLRSLGRRDTYVFVWMIALVAGFPQWVIGHGLAIAAVNVALLVLHVTVFRGRAR
ncbi:MAG: CDP-alcohol phosphatidyltransferase family protein [Deltaproteobacteria bacterium]|nr:MAG: CDP-alcohol phosphatidyltransferase family protein [Deltaproteobacteria bacterium]TMQ24765.1 MAG: CDP-alcohol phosphatidyltransferase family protein [Deltaproteobacteria bacterium]